MIKQFSDANRLLRFLDSSAYASIMKERQTVLIKINLARPPEQGHPRTDAELLSNVVDFVLRNGCICGIAECANGYLEDNLRSIGLDWIIKERRVRIIDLDQEASELVLIEDQQHYIPECLKEYGFRIAIPASSKRPNAVFSNNVKLFVGAVPRRMYQIGEPVSWRPRVHVELHKSVANIYRAIMQYSPFHLYINGGTAMHEEVGEFQFEEVLLGDNALELDQYVADKIFKIDKPEYMYLLNEL